MHTAVEALLLVGILPVVATGNECRNRPPSPGNYIEVASVSAAKQAQNHFGDFRLEDASGYLHSGSSMPSIGHWLRLS